MKRKRNSVFRMNKRLSRNSEGFGKSLVTKKFSVILQTMKEAQKPKLKIEIEEPIKTIEKPKEKEIIPQSENLEDQKILAKLYKNDYTKTFENIRKDYYPERFKKDLNQEPKKVLITETDTKITKEMLDTPSLTLTLPNKKKPKYGFQQFNRTNYVSKSSMKEFYNKFAQYNTLRRKYPKGIKTPSWAFIRTTTEEKIIPNPLGLIKRYGDEKILGINNQKVGDNYMNALCNSIKYSEHLETLEFGGNRLSSLGVSHIFKALNENKNLALKIKCIDLSENHIGKSQIANLINFLQDDKCNIENLNLFGNFLGNDNIKPICDALASFVGYKLEILNLGKNNITPAI